MVVLISVFLGGIVAFAAWRQLDRRADTRAWDELTAAVGTSLSAYDPAMVNELPEPAQRYFNYMIEPGALLYTVVELDMTGEIGLGTKEAPNYRAMNAHQILVPPYGLVWQLESGPLSGSDGALPDQSWTRFWLYGLLPVVRVGDPDHRRSAFGRVVAEAAFWAPASLLPGEYVHWEAVDANRTRAVVRFGTGATLTPTRNIANSHSAASSLSFADLTVIACLHGSRAATISTRPTIFLSSGPR